MLSRIRLNIIKTFCFILVFIFVKNDLCCIFLWADVVFWAVSFHAPLIKLWVLFFTSWNNISFCFPDQKTCWCTTAQQVESTLSSGEKWVRSNLNLEGVKHQQHASGRLWKGGFLHLGGVQDLPFKRRMGGPISVGEGPVSDSSMCWAFSSGKHRFSFHCGRNHRTTQ